MTNCQKCGKPKINIKSALFQAKYYSAICDSCLVSGNDELSSNAAGYERRRGYEDNAGDTIQPYDANGPNSEFARLYPEAASKVFNQDTINELRRKI